MSNELLKHAHLLWKPEYKQQNILCGFLHKRVYKENLYRTWIRRWFVFKDALLFYFSDKNDLDPAGVIFLDSSATVKEVAVLFLAENVPAIDLFVRFSVSLRKGAAFSNRKYILAASSPLECSAWTEALTIAINSLVKPAMAVQHPSRRLSDSMLDSGSNRQAFLSDTDHVMSNSAAASGNNLDLIYTSQRASKSSPCLLLSAETQCVNIHGACPPTSSVPCGDAPTLVEYNVNVIVCKSIADLIRLMIHAVFSIRKCFTSEDTAFLTDDDGFLDVSSCYERHACLFAQIFTICQQLELEIQDLDARLIDPAAMAALKDYKSSLFLIIAAFTASWRPILGGESVDQSAFAQADRDIDSLSEACFNFLTAVTSIVKEQLFFINRQTMAFLGNVNGSGANGNGSFVPRWDPEDERYVSELIAHEEASINDPSQRLVFKATSGAGVVGSNSSLLGGSSSVRGGSLERLLEHLTSHIKPDSFFTSAFLLTYRTFTTPEQFFDLLITRYSQNCPEELTLPQQEIYNFKKLIPIRLRVLNVVKQWAKNEFDELVSNSTLQESFGSFLSLIRTDFRKSASDIEELLAKIRQPASILDRLDFTASVEMDRKWTDHENLDLFDTDPIEVAQQLTLLEWDLFVRIKPIEFLFQAWNHKDLQSRAPNIVSLIKNSTEISYWIISEITKHANLNGRIAALYYFIVVAEESIRLNNFSSAMAILAGLNSAAITRLKKTWLGIPMFMIKSFESMNELLSESRSYRLYRSKLASCNPPCIPFLGMYLTNLVFIETGNRDMLPEHPALINFEKRCRMAKIIEEIRSFQSTPYRLQALPQIQRFLQQRSIDDDQVLYERSLLREPREAAVDNAIATDAKYYSD